MKCPGCNNKAISFFNWIIGLNAFKYNCESCDQEIKANFITYLLFILTLVMAFLAFPYVENIWRFIGVEEIHSKLKNLILFPIATFGGIITWFIGGYKLIKKI